MARILLDTNIWREIAEREMTERLRLTARGANVEVVIAPGVVYEMLRKPNQDLRRKQIKAVTLRSWTRLMTEVYSECEDLRSVITKYRPEWLRSKPDLAAFYRQRADWTGGGFWARARQDPDREAAFVMQLGDSRLEQARRDAKENRELMSHLSYDSVSLKGWTARVPDQERGWEVRDVEAWRLGGAISWRAQLITHRSQPHLDWLGPFIDLNRLARDEASWNALWAHDVAENELPREWMRWAVGWLQGLRKVTTGTPGDNQISLYAYEADMFVTADRTFADILAKVRKVAPAPVAEPRLVRADAAGAEAVITLVERGLVNS